MAGKAKPDPKTSKGGRYRMGKNVHEAMTSNPCAIEADRSVAYAAKMLKQEDVGVAPIVESGRLVGMLTDRDIVVRVVAEGKDPDSVSVRDVASSNVVSIDPRQDLDEALQLMARYQVRRLPVVEQDGRLVGVVAQADIAEVAKPKKTGELVEEISRD
jgi:CBS domain-containing protein